MITGFIFGLMGLASVLYFRYYMIQKGQIEFSFTFNSSFVTNMLIFYPLMVIIQETMTKGFFQSYFVSVFDGIRFNKTISILLSSMIFAQFYLFYGTHIFFFTLIYSIILGIYYKQSRSILGFFIIHYSIGMGLLGGSSFFG